jgi:hypothetical protein
MNGPRNGTDGHKEDRRTDKQTREGRTVQKTERQRSWYRRTTTADTGTLIQDPHAPGVVAGVVDGIALAAGLAAWRRGAGPGVVDEATGVGGVAARRLATRDVLQCRAHGLG